MMKRTIAENTAEMSGDPESDAPAIGKTDARNETPPQPHC
jgi:hypothetical protein